MKLNKFFKNKLINKVWLYFTSFSIAILAGLWLFQVAFLSMYYEYQKTAELNRIASKVTNAYGSSDFEDVLDEITYNSGVCIELTTADLIKYSSMSFSKGCIDTKTSSTYKKVFLQSGEDKKTYKVTNSKFDNNTLVYSLKLDEDLYVFINVSLQPIGSTTTILASQLVYVTIIVLLLSFVVAYFVSKKLSAPIVKMNATAMKMSKGNYDVLFKTDTDILEIDELSKTLNKACEELSKTEELRRELLANVSHDLKTPLTMIRAYAEMVRDLTYNDKEKMDSNLNVIIDETDRLNILVSDILELSKIQSDVENLNLEEIYINKFIDEIIKRFDYLTETKGYILTFNKTTDDVSIKADKHKLEQVIYNLISNAINYVGKDKTIIVNSKLIDDDVKIEVIDHGKGIDSEEISLIWDKYYKIDKTHKRNYIGTGLGLSIVKNILIKHGFIYGVNSIKRKGTTFYFEAPIIKK